MTAPVRRRATGSPATTVLGAVALLTLAGTVALGLALPLTREQRVYSRLIAIHPALAWTAYVAVVVTALASALYLWPRTRDRKWDRLAAASAEVGVVFIALMLATGSIWGRPTWGVWWTWDARLTTSALMLVLAFGYLAVRRVPADVDLRARRSAVTALLAAVVVPVNHMAVEWWRTLHQGRSLAELSPGDNLDGAFIGAMLLGFVAMTLVYAWLVAHRYRVEEMEEQRAEHGLEIAIAQRRAEAEMVAR
jgi:heme exporter protein C